MTSPGVSQSSPLLVSFSGIDGSGKSTQIEKLCVRLSDAGLLVSRLAFWDDVVAFSGFRAGLSHRFLQSEGGVGTPEKPVRRNDKNVRNWYMSAARSGLYVLDAVRLRHVVTKAKRLKPEVLVFDRYIFDQLATLPLEHAMARTYAQFILNLVPRPDIAYLLDADPEAARARKPEYPLEFLHQYRASYRCLEKMAGMTMMPALNVDEVHNAIMLRFESASGLKFPAADLESIRGDAYLPLRATLRF